MAATMRHFSYVGITILLIAVSVLPVSAQGGSDSTQTASATARLYLDLGYLRSSTWATTPGVARRRRPTSIASE
jgi:hypothetical protein